jgi:hypothetical protein
VPRPYPEHWKRRQLFGRSFVKLLITSLSLAVTYSCRQQRQFTSRGLPYSLLRASPFSHPVIQSPSVTFQPPCCAINAGAQPPELYGSSLPQRERRHQQHLFVPPTRRRGRPRHLFLQFRDRPPAPGQQGNTRPLLQKHQQQPRRRHRVQQAAAAATPPRNPITSMPPSQRYGTS